MTTSDCGSLLIATMSETSSPSRSPSTLFAVRSATTCRETRSRFVAACRSGSPVSNTLVVLGSSPGSRNRMEACAVYSFVCHSDTPRAAPAVKRTHRQTTHARLRERLGPPSGARFPLRRRPEDFAIESRQERDARAITPLRPGNRAPATYPASGVVRHAAGPPDYASALVRIAGKLSFSESVDQDLVRRMCGSASFIVVPIPTALHLQGPRSASGTAPRHHRPGGRRSTDMRTRTGR